MTDDAAMLLLDELTDLEIRCRIQEARLPGDPDLFALRQDIAQKRADIIDHLAALRVADRRSGLVH